MGQIQLHTPTFTMELTTYEPVTVTTDLPSTVSGIHTFQFTLK